MDINKPSRAGTLESNDIYIMVLPNENGGIKLSLESSVLKQFGYQIEKVIMDTLLALEVKDIIINAKDRGALDYTIKSRVETAVKRAGGII